MHTTIEKFNVHQLRHAARRLHTTFVKKFHRQARYLAIDMWYASQASVDIDRPLRAAFKQAPKITFVGFNPTFQISRPYLINSVKETSHVLAQIRPEGVRIMPSMKIYDPRDKKDYFKKRTLRFRHMSVVILDQLGYKPLKKPFVVPNSSFKHIKTMTYTQALIAPRDLKGKIVFLINKLEPESDQHKVGEDTFLGSEILANVVMWQVRQR